MKRSFILWAVALLVLVLEASAQTSNPLRINCPPNRTNWLCGVASTAIVTYPAPTTTAACPTNAIVTCSPPSGTLFILGTTTVTCRATNSCRESAVCTFTVTVARDTQPPSINCPPSTNVTACASSGAVVNYPTPTATDNADFNVPVVCSPASGSVFPVGTTTVTCTATDDCTNRTTCTFLVRVTRDTTPPSITCPTNRTVLLCGTAASIPVMFPSPVVSDNLDPDVIVTCSPPSGSSFPAGTNTVACTATDDCSNTRSCSFTITVIRDITPPSIVCPSNMVFNCLCPGSTIVLDFFKPTVTDDHDPNPTVVCVPPSLVSSPGVHPVVCTATDNCGNSNQCSFTVTFNYDTTPPVISCPTNLTVWSCSNSAVVRYPVTAADNCTSTVTLVCTPPSGSVFPLGTSTVLCSATDSCTNRSTCTFTVTVRPPLFYNGLCHSTLGLAGLNVNANDELEVLGLGSSGQDGVRIELGESQGLSWQMRLPTAGEVDGRDFLVWQRTYGQSTAGTEIQLGEVLFARSRGQLSLTPSAASYRLTLLRNGAVVYRESGRSGAFALPVCTPVWNEHCWGNDVPEFPDNPLLPHCMWLLGQVCDVETPGGPVQADALVVTPEDPLPPFTALTAIEFLGRDVPVLTLRQERLMMFGDEEQPPLAHRGQGEARLVARDGALTVANLGSSGQDGVSIGLGNGAAGFQWRMRNPAGELEGDVEFAMYGRPSGGAAIPLRRITHHYRNGRLSVTPGSGPYEIKLLRQGQVVFQQGGRTGAVDLPDCEVAENEHCVGEPFAGWNPHLPYCINFLTVECDWETPNGPVRADTIVLTPEDSVPPVVEMDALHLLAQVNHLSSPPSLTLLSERVLKAGGTGAFRLTCPPDITVRTCSTNPAQVFFRLPVVNGGVCTSLPQVTCVPPSGSGFPPGTNTVQCTATNLCGEVATCSFTVTVIGDTTPPTIHCPTNVTVFTANTAGRAVHYGPLVTTDDPAATISCVPPAGSVFPVGVTPVVCTTRDACGNQETCTFTVEVKMLRLLVNPGASGPVLSWTGDAILETSDEVSGPWVAVRGATSPYLVAFVGAKKFFRLTAPVEDVDCGEVELSPSEWNIDVPSVRIQGRFLLDGRPFPSSFLQGANFFLRRASTGDEVYLGLSNNETFDRRVVPGTYDVIYEHKIGDEVPLNTVAIVIAGLEISADQTFDIDVPSVGVSGAFLLNGVLAQAVETENGRILWRDRRNGALTAIGETKLQSYAARMIPGAYDFMYSRITGSALVPANALTAFRRDVSVVANGVVDIDVPVIHVTGEFTINGVSAPDSETETGRIFLLDPDSGAKVLFGQTRYQNYDMLIIPGTYDFVYSRMAGSGIVPANSNARFLTGASLQADGVFDINLPVARISGDFLVNGAPAPDIGTEWGRIHLRNDDDIVYLGDTDNGSFNVLALHGTYESIYTHVSGSAIMPANTNAVLGSVVIAGETEFDIDIPTASYSADVRFNGGNFPGPIAGESARLFLEDTVTGGLVALAYNYPAFDQVSRLMVRGTYRVRYEYESGTTLPRNTFATLGSSLVLTQNLETVIDVRAVALSGDFRLNGGAFPGGQNAAVTVRSLGGEDSLYLGGTSGGTYSTVIVPGRYSAFYNWAAGDSIPRNQNARLVCPR